MVVAVWQWWCCYLSTLQPQHRQDCLSVSAADSLESPTITHKLEWTESHPFSPTATQWWHRKICTGDFLIRIKLNMIWMKTLLLFLLLRWIICKLKVGTYNNQVFFAKKQTNDGQPFLLLPSKMKQTRFGGLLVKYSTSESSFIKDIRITHFSFWF